MQEITATRRLLPLLRITCLQRKRCYHHVNSVQSERGLGAVSYLVVKGRVAGCQHEMQCLNNCIIWNNLSKSSEMCGSQCCGEDLSNATNGMKPGAMILNLRCENENVDVFFTRHHVPGTSTAVQVVIVSTNDCFKNYNVCALLAGYQRAQCLLLQLLFSLSSRPVTRGMWRGS